MKGHRSGHASGAASASLRGERGDRRAARIVDAVRAIPEGFVRTYGDIEPAAPRLVGRLLGSNHDLPWQRVVRADGSLPMGRRQRELLLKEGVPMRGERVDLSQARVPSELAWPVSTSEQPPPAGGAT